MSVINNWIAKGYTAPILYLPMKDKTTCHQNLGTGGDFVQNGLIETADVGVNYMTCRASKFDGVDDYLLKQGFAGILPSKKTTVSFNFVVPALGTRRVITGWQQNNINNVVQIDRESTNQLRMYFQSTSGIIVFAQVPATSLPAGKHISVQLSFDTASTTTRHLVVNGVIQADTVFTTYTVDGIIAYSSTNSREAIGAYETPSDYFNSSIGEFYMDVSNYIDLATNNPFWDSVNNKPIPVRKVMQDTGAMPLIAMPIDASNPGKNYGSSGDFTLFG